MEILDDHIEGGSTDTSVKPGTIRMILADSQAIYRVGIRKVFALEDDIRVVAQADSLENLRAAVERYPTDIVLLEGSMLAGTANAIPELLRLAPDMKLIVQAVASDENHTVELYRGGCRQSPPPLDERDRASQVMSKLHDDPALARRRRPPLLPILGMERSCGPK